MLSAECSLSENDQKYIYVSFIYTHIFLFQLKSRGHQKKPQNIIAKRGTEEGEVSKIKNGVKHT